MSGHSKWSTIRHKKAAGDLKKGKEFTRVAKQIYIAVKKGNSGDPDKNPSLRLALEAARAANMPNENVRRAIERGMGTSKDGNEEIEVTYEGYGPGGVAIMITVVTDNKNRTGGEIKSLFDKSGGSLGGPGSVSYLRSMQPPLLVNLEGGDLSRANMLLDELDDLDETVSLWANLEGYEQTS